MLARPEYNTREDIRLWLAGKDPNEEFPWKDCIYCACGQYMRERGRQWDAWEGPTQELNQIAGKLARLTYGHRMDKNWFLAPLTFGALLAEVDRHWDLSRER